MESALPPPNCCKGECWYLQYGNVGMYISYLSGQYLSIPLQKNFVVNERQILRSYIIMVSRTIYTPLLQIPSTPIDDICEHYNKRYRKRNTSNTTPPLLTLPPEILHRILSHFSTTPEPTLAILRRTHRTFYNIIHPTSVSRGDGKELRAQRLTIAENSTTPIFPPEHHACYTCLHVKPTSAFADRLYALQKTKWGRSVRTERFCIACGVARGRYKRGAYLKIGGVLHVVCRSCGVVHRADGDRIRKHFCHPNAGPLGLLLLATVAMKFIRYVTPVPKVVYLPLQVIFLAPGQQSLFINSAIRLGGEVCEYLVWSDPNWWVL